MRVQSVTFTATVRLDDQTDALSAGETSSQPLADQDGTAVKRYHLENAWPSAPDIPAGFDQLSSSVDDK